MTRPLDYRDVLREASRDVGVAVDEALLAALHSERLAAKAAPFAPVDVEVLDALRHLKALGLKLCLISNCAVEEVAAWDASPLAPLFDAAVFSFAVGCAKPDPAIYRLACRRPGVAPQRCCFVGDGGADELAGAAPAGLVAYRAAWFLERWPAWRQATPDRASSAAFPALRSLDELVGMLGATFEVGSSGAET